ncbi:MAG: PEP-CTERM sorting domain-containing protein [Myxococcota bacterium]
MPLDSLGVLVPTQLVVFAPIVALLVVPAAQAAMVTLNPGTATSVVEARAGNDRTFITVPEAPTAVPGSGTLMSSEGTGTREASSDVEYSLTDSGFTTSFEFVLPDRRSASTALFQDTYFSVSEDQSYRFSGTFDSAHSEPGRTTLDIVLYDITTGTTLFRNQQRSLSTQNASFVVGGQDADWVNVLGGRLSGFVLAGHEYQLTQIAFVNNPPLASTSATASGAFSIAFSAVPEPTTALLLGFGLAFLGLRKEADRMPAVHR